MDKVQKSSDANCYHRQNLLRLLLRQSVEPYARAVYPCRRKESFLVRVTSRQRPSPEHFKTTVASVGRALRESCVPLQTEGIVSCSRNVTSAPCLLRVSICSINLFNWACSCHPRGRVRHCPPPHRGAHPSFRQGVEKVSSHYLWASRGFGSQ
jgi:hypothetical protein